MKLTDQERATRANCSVCGKMLRSDSTGGVHGRCKKKAVADAKPKSSPPRKLKTKRGRPPKNGTSVTPLVREAVANICVPESALDAFWQKLSVEEKAELFVRQMQGA